MTLRQKEYLAIGLALGGAVLGLLGARGSTGWTPVTVIAMVIVLTGLALRLKWHRCPSCGKYLGRHCPQFCPNCGSHIEYDEKK